MDWNIFWTAFGAIGTTIGSLITAFAVVVAVKQYRQPLKKIVKVEFSSAIGSLLGNPIELYYISIKNKGIRELQIDSLNILGKKKILWMNNAQYDLYEKKKFPVNIGQEECKNFWFEAENFRNAINAAVNDKVLNKNQKLIILVKDSLGDEYFCKTNMKIKNIIKNI